MMDLNWQLKVPNEAEQERSLFPHYMLNEIIVGKAFSQDGLDRMKALNVRDSDIFLCSHPRSGTHWLAYIISLIVHNGQLQDDSDRGIYNSISYLPNKENFELVNDPRIFFTHLPYQYYKEMGRESKKMIYITRNPKEVAVSFYNLLIKFDHSVGFKGTMDQFVDCFVKGETYYGGWLANVSEWWIHRNDDNVLFIWYEDLLNDFSETVKKIGDYLGYPLSPELAEIIRKKASFDEMKTDKETKISKLFRITSSDFFRSGTNNTWKKELTHEQKEKIDRLLEQASRTLNWDVKFL